MNKDGIEKHLEYIDHRLSTILRNLESLWSGNISHSKVKIKAGAQGIRARVNKIKELIKEDE